MQSLYVWRYIFNLINFEKFKIRKWKTRSSKFTRILKNVINLKISNNSNRSISTTTNGSYNKRKNFQAMDSNCHWFLHRVWQKRSLTLEFHVALALPFQLFQTLLHAIHWAHAHAAWLPWTSPYSEKFKKVVSKNFQMISAFTFSNRSDVYYFLFSSLKLEWIQKCSKCSKVKWILIEWICFRLMTYWVLCRAVHIV